MSLKITGIDHPAIAVTDVDKIADWYCEVLGFEKEHRHDKPIWIIKAPDDTLIEIMPRDNTPRPKRTVSTPGWSHLALRVDDIEQSIVELNKEGVQWLGETVEAIGGGKLRSFTDPEGNMLQIVER